MARGNSSRGNAKTNDLSLATLLTPKIRHYVPAPVRPLVIRTPKNLRLILDRRAYHPEPRFMRPPGAVERKAARLNTDNLGRSVRDQMMRVRFAMPDKVAICLRRKARREVLHALDLTRRSGKGGAKRRRNTYSSVRC